MEYVGENVITPVMVARILRNTRSKKIKTGSAIYYQIIRNAVDDGEAALLRTVKGDINLRGMFVPGQELDHGQVKLRILPSPVFDLAGLEDLLKKSFNVYFRSSGLLYGFESRPEETVEDSLVFRLPRLVLKLDRRKIPRVEPALLPSKYRRECSTVLFTGDNFYRLECELADISVTGLGLNINRVVGDKRYEAVMVTGAKTPIEFVLASKPMFAEADVIYVDCKVERAGVVLRNVVDNRRQPAGKWVQEWVDKIMYGEAVDISKKGAKKKREKRLAIITSARIKESMKEMAKGKEGKEPEPELASVAEEEEQADQLSGVSEVLAQPEEVEAPLTTRPMRVVLIDGHRAECRLVELFLINRNDYKIAVKTVHDSQTGLKTVILDRPDLVLVDPLLEGDINNGVLLIQRIRSNRLLRGIPVIGITSALDKVTIQKLLSAGVQYVVSKKSPLSVLWDKINDVFESVSER